MAIISGYQKMKDYIKQTSGYQLLSRWANANTLECDDGNTLQSKVGGISGISSSLTANSSTQAASTQLTNQLYQNLNQVSSAIEERLPDEVRIIVEGSGTDVKYYAQTGADSVSKKELGKSDIKNIQFHVQSQVSGWASASMTIPETITTMKIYSNVINGGNIVSGIINGETIQIGVIDKNTMENPNIFDISGYESISVRVQGAASHAYWIVY